MGVVALASLLVTLAGQGNAQTSERGASTGARVAVLGSGRDAAAAARIAAELRAFGFAAQVRIVEAPPDAAEGERALRGGARAIVQLDGRAGKTQVLIAEPGGRSVHIPVILEGTVGTIDPVLIVRTVELVRAGLLRPAAAPREPTATTPQPQPPVAVATPPAPPPPAPPETTSSAPPPPPPSPSSPPAAPPPPPPTPPPPEVVAVTPPPVPTPSQPPVVPDAAPDTRRWRTAASTGIAVASGGLEPEVVLQVQVAARLAGPLHAEVFGVAPLTSSEKSAMTGSSQSTAWLAGAGATALAHAGPFWLEAGAGALAVWLRSSGVPAPSQPLTAATDSQVGAAAYGRVGAALPLGPRLAARIDVLGGDVFRRPVIRFGSVTQVAAWGPAFLLAVAGLDLRW